MDAEKVVVELIAEQDKFDKTVVQSATTYEGSMNRIITAGAKAEASTKRMSSAALQASTAMYKGYEDVGKFLQSSNASPFVVPVKAGPQVTRALGLVQAGATALGGVMGGALTIAVLEAAGAMYRWITSGNEAKRVIDELVQKMKEKAEQTERNRQADEAWKQTIEGVTEAIRKRREEQEKSLSTDREQLEKSLQGATDERDTARRLRDQAARDLASAKQELADAQAAFQEQARKPGRAQEGITALAAVRVGKAEAEVKRLTTALQQATVAADEAVVAVRTAMIPIARADAAAAVDPLKAINDEFDRQARSAEKAAEGNNKLAESLGKTLAGIEANRKAALDAARDGATGKLPAVTGSEVAKILGTTINPGGGTRTPAQNKRVGGAANSYHLSGQAIDIPLTINGKPLTKEGIRSELEAAGVIIKELLGPGDKDHDDHFHIAFDKRRAGADQISAARERQAAKQEAAAQAEERREQAFQNEKASLQDDELDLRRQLKTSLDEIFATERQAVELSRQKYNDNLLSLEAQKKLLPEEAAELKRINEERAKLRLELIKRREDEAKFRIQESENQQRLAVDSANRSVQEELLQGQRALATTQSQRRELELRLLELQYQEERQRLQYQIDYAERLKLQKGIKESELREAEAAAEIARLKLQSLEQRKGQDQQGVLQNTQSPLQSFFGNIPNEAAKINEALESIAAGGLATLTDRLTDAIVNWRGFGQAALAALRSVAAGVIRLGIQQLLLATIGKAMGTAAVATTAAQAASAAAAWAPAAAAASLATLGANAGPAAAALAATHALSAALSIPKGFRKGGYTGDGPVHAAAGIVHGREFVFDADSTRRIGVGNLEALRSGVRPSNAAAIAPGGGGGGLSPDALAQFRSLLAEAIAAMPPINLHPTVRPEDALEAALASGRGRKLMLDFFDVNRGAVNGTLKP